MFTSGMLVVADCFVKQSTRKTLPLWTAVRLHISQFAALSWQVRHGDVVTCSCPSRDADWSNITPLCRRGAFRLLLSPASAQHQLPAQCQRQ